jgi:hypothetical protein
MRLTREAFPVFKVIIAAPDSTDFQNGARAPQNSFAALHADLIAEGSGYGVRVSKKSNQVVISWLTHYFSQRAGAPVRIWVTLHSNGSIDQFISFGSGTVESAVASAATIGISGKTPISATTFAFNDSNIRSGLGLRWASSCGGGGSSAASVSKLNVRAVTSRSRTRSNSKYITPGTKIKVSLAGGGDGSVALSAKIDSYQCTVPAIITLKTGKASLVSRIPTTLSAKAVKFNVGNLSKRIYLNSSRNVKRVKRSSRIKLLDRACSSLLHL